MRGESTNTTEVLLELEIFNKVVKFVVVLVPILFSRVHFP